MGAKPACRRARARACKRDPRDCLARYAPLVQQDARDGVQTMLEGKRCGLSYEELSGHAPADVAAAEAWVARANTAARKRA